ncbi:hypothetical protein F4820DRAFT_442211 [Hypoxylon rubiginosum]|uniref:Uncharacterized protein n=1 Tax=Hypoxylon rubiginosum TaxID=110542 RepID=A0ACB9YHZ2_9PEZI|nr:hypothetical protein F4820DRAFT_442211 [Hypoxylon rubiginosum]
MNAQLPSLTQLPKGAARKKILRRIDFYHPGYVNMPPLFTARASDDGGVHYNVAYYACCIIAGNVWHDDEGRTDDTLQPFFSSTPAPTSRIPAPADGILRGAEYYFQVPLHVDNYGDGIIEEISRTSPYDDVPYPIVPSFKHWDFPRTIPRPWRNLPFYPVVESGSESPNPDSGNLDTSNDRPLRGENNSITYTDPSTRRTVIIHDEVCRITGSTWGLELCHIIPQEANQWFNANHMRKYQETSLGEKNAGAIDDFSNVVHLRKDLHKIVDRSYIVFFPIPVPAPPAIESTSTPTQSTSTPAQSTSTPTQATPDSSVDYRLVCHILHGADKSLDTTLEVHQLFHGKPIFPLIGVPPEYLFARFAFSVLCLRSMPIMRQKKEVVTFRAIEPVPMQGRRVFLDESTPTKYRKESKSDPSAGNKRSRNQVDSDEDDLESLYDSGLDTDMDESESDVASVDSAYYQRPIDYSSSSDNYSSDSDSDPDMDRPRKRSRFSRDSNWNHEMKPSTMPYFKRQISPPSSDTELARSSSTSHWAHSPAKRNVKFETIIERNGLTLQPRPISPSMTDTESVPSMSRSVDSIATNNSSIVDHKELSVRQVALEPTKSINEIVDPLLESDAMF